MTSEIRLNTLKNRVGLGTVNFTNTGPVVSGIVTANSFSATGDLDIDGHTNLDNLNVVGVSTFNGDINIDDGAADSAAGPELKLNRGSASPANSDYLGQIKFAGRSSTGAERNYAKITGKILDVTNGSEDGILEFAHIKAGSQTVTGRWRSDSLQLLNSTSLVVTGTTSFSDHVEIADNKKLSFGASTDFKIEHNTNENYIDSNSGHIYIRANVNDDEGDNIYIQPKSGENSAVFIHDGAVELYHNNNKTFETTNEGVTLDTNSSSTILRLNSNTDAVSMLQAVGNDLYVKAPSSGSIYMIGNGNEVKLSIYSNGKLATNSASSVDCGVGGLHLYLGDGARNDYSTAADGLIIEKNGTTGLSIDPGSSGTANIYFPNESNHSIAQISHNNSTGEFRIRGEDHIILSTNGNTERLRIDSSGRVMIGGGSSPSQVGDGQLIVYSSDRLHPAIKCAGMINNYANGYSMLADNYTATESQMSLGLSYSSSALVLSRGVKVSGTQDDVYLSSQAQYATRPSAIRLDHSGNFIFLTTETSATTAVDTAVTLSNRFQIDRSGNIYQKPSGRSMYFGSGNNLRIGVQTNGDPNIEAVSGDLKIMDGGNVITQVRSDGLENFQHVYPAADNSKDLGKSGRRWANIYTTDLHLSNEGKSNVVDGTWGDWTLQEGESDLFLINNRNGKKYQFMLKEIS